MAKKLKNIIIDRVDLVDSGANPEAHVVLFKRNSKEGDMSKTKLNKGELDLDSIEGLTDEHKEKIRELQAKVEESATVISDLEEATKNLEAAKEANDGLTKRVSELEKKVEPEPEPEIKMSKAARERFDQEVEKREALEKKLNEEIEKRELMKAEKKAETVWANLPGSPAEKGAALRWIEKNHPEEGAVRQTIETMLKSGDEFAKQFTKTTGSEGGTSTSAWDKISHKAAEMIEKGLFKNADGTSFTMAQAVDKVLETDPALYTEYRAEKSRAN